MIPQEIIDYILKKYKPNAVLLHGSRARGDAFEKSDYDMELIGSFDQDISPESFNSYMLDLGASPPTRDSLRSGSTPILPLIVIYDDENKYGQAILERTESLYRKGPEPLESWQIENRKNFCRRLYNRLEHRYDDIQLRTNQIADFHERVVRYHFELSQKWTSSLHHSLMQIKTENPDLYDALETLCRNHDLVTVRSIFAMLFAEEL